MQGQGGIGSFTDAVDINHGSTSSAAVRPQVCWNSVQNAGDNRSPNYVVAPGGIGVTHVNPAGQERQTVSRLSFGGPSSSSIQNEVSRDEHKTEYIWSSSSRTFLRNEPSFGGQHNEMTNRLSLDNINSNPTNMQGSNRNGTTQNINLNADYRACGADNCPPNVGKSSGTETERMQPAAGPDPSSLPSGNSGYLVEENNGRLGFPLEGCRFSRKRKFPEVNVGESSSSGSRRSLLRGETTTWPAVLADGSGSSLSISPPSEQVNSIINVQARRFASNTLQNSTLAGNPESSRRNLRMRVNPSSQPESAPPHMHPIGTATRPSSTLSSQQPLRTYPVISGDWRTHAEPETTISQDQPAAIHIPPMPRNMQPLRWNSASLMNPGISSSSVVSENRNAPREESGLRSYRRNLPSQPRIPSSTEIRNLVTNPTNRNMIGGNLTTPRHAASASGTGSSSAVPSSAAPSWVPPANPPPQYTQRLSDYVRRSLFSPVGPESGGQGSSYPLLLAGSSIQETLLPSGAGNQNQNQSNARSAQWIGRQGDAVLAIPNHFRNSAAASGPGRRGRLVSEIRSVLDLMRRGQGGLRLEDLIFLDQSALVNIADIHDRHRDMRLDVDNMSYEELLALGERIGDVNTGLNEETILSRLKHLKFFNFSDGQEETEPCCICQEEYDDGDDLGRLDCGHDFHRDCIKQWLTHKNLCPICKTTGLKK